MAPASWCCVVRLHHKQGLATKMGISPPRAHFSMGSAELAWALAWAWAAVEHEAYLAGCQAATAEDWGEVRVGNPATWSAPTVGLEPTDTRLRALRSTG